MYEKRTCGLRHNDDNGGDAMSDAIISALLTISSIINAAGIFVIIKAGIDWYVKRKTEGGNTTTDKANADLEQKAKNDATSNIKHAESALDRAEKMLFRGKRRSLNELLLLRYEVHAYEKAKKLYDDIRNNSAVMDNDWNKNAGKKIKLNKLHADYLLLSHYLQAGVKDAKRSERMEGRAFRMYNKGIDKVQENYKFEKKFEQNVRVLGKIEFHENDQAAVGAHHRGHIKEHVDYLKAVNESLKLHNLGWIDNKGRDPSLVYQRDLSKLEIKVVNELKYHLSKLVEHHGEVEKLKTQSQSMFKTFSNSKCPLNVGVKDSEKFSAVFKQISVTSPYVATDKVTVNSGDVVVKSIVHHLRDKPFGIQVDGTDKKFGIKRLCDEWHHVYAKMAAEIQYLTTIMDKIDKMQGLEKKLQKMVEHTPVTPPHNLNKPGSP